MTRRMKQIDSWMRNIWHQIVKEEYERSKRQHIRFKRYGFTEWQFHQLDNFMNLD